MSIYEEWPWLLDITEALTLTFYLRLVCADIDMKIFNLDYIGCADIDMKIFNLDNNNNNKNNDFISFSKSEIHKYNNTVCLKTAAFEHNYCSLLVFAIIMTF